MAIAVAFAAAAAARPSRPVGLAFTRQKTRWVFSPLASSSYSAQPPASPSSRRKQLILYSKPGCCLCDGLKEKIKASFFLSGTPYSLHDVDLQIRDITTNPEWERAYQYEIPVLARVLSDGTEEILPRLSPRLGVELLQKKLAAALSQ